MSQWETVLGRERGTTCDNADDGCLLRICAVYFKAAHPNSSALVCFVYNEAEHRLHPLCPSQNRL